MIEKIVLFWAEKYLWTKILLFLHLVQIVFVLQDNIPENITMAIALSILGGYYTIFMVIAFLFFKSGILVFKLLGQLAKLAVFFRFKTGEIQRGRENKEEK